VFRPRFIKVKKKINAKQRWGKEQSQAEERTDRQGVKTELVGKEPPVYSGRGKKS